MISGNYPLYIKISVNNKTKIDWILNFDNYKLTSVTK